LLVAGKRVFERDGFLQARITDIAAEAGVSHGSFYHYFETKEAIFREIAEGIEVQLLSMNDTAHEHKVDSDPVERIRTANRSYLDAYRKESKIMKVIEEVSRYDEKVRLVRLRRDNELAERLESTISRLQRNGLADKRINGRYAAMALGGMVARFAEQLFVGGGSYDQDEAVEQLTILWANALGMVPGGRGTQRTKG
jgi:AcrR family transcriptional regulator